MGTLGGLLGVRDKNKIMGDLRASIGLLRTSVFDFLCGNLYGPRFSIDESRLLARAVLSVLLAEEPFTDDDCSFLNKNEDRVWVEALQVKKYPELSGRDGAVSCLLFAEICYETDMLNEPDIEQYIYDITNKSLIQLKLESDPSRRKTKTGIHNSKVIYLNDRAEQLGIFIPTAKDICESNDMAKIVKAISIFANSKRWRFN